jgi:hypothetical protein
MIKQGGAMAISLEFLNLVVPIHRIKEIYPDGWSGCLRDHAKSIGRIVWYDDHLFRTGAMDFDMMDHLIEKWTRLGFEATELVEGKTVWTDFCVLGSFGSSQHQCPWLVVDRAERIAWMRDAERGEAIGREQRRYQQIFHT